MNAKKIRLGRIKSVDKKASSRPDNWGGGGGGVLAAVNRKNQKPPGKDYMYDTLKAFEEEGRDRPEVILT
jgi:hypothetical protein